MWTPEHAPQHPLCPSSGIRTRDLNPAIGKRSTTELYRGCVRWLSSKCSGCLPSSFPAKGPAGKDFPSIRHRVGWTSNSSTTSVPPRGIEPLQKSYKDFSVKPFGPGGSLLQQYRNFNRSVHLTGLEPARPFGHSPLKRERLPFRHKCKIAHRGRSKTCEPEDLEGCPTRPSFVR